MRDILIEFMDSLRDYVAESGTNIAHDERDSSEFVDIFLNQGQSLPIDIVSGCYYAENGTVYRNDDDLNTIVCFLNRDTGSYTSLPKDVAEKVAEMLNNR